MVLGILQLGYLVFKDWDARAGQPSQTSQDGTGYPGILSIQGLGCYGRPAIRGHPRMVLAILGYLGHPRMVLAILGYLVFKDWGVMAGQPSGDIPGWYWVSWDT